MSATIAEPGLRDALPAGRHFRQRSRRAGEQHGERVLRLAQAALELRDRGKRAQVLRLRLLHVEFGVVAVLEQPFGDLQAALLQRGVLARDRQAQLEGADRRIEGAACAATSTCRSSYWAMLAK
jgi:hypothetical protein